MFYIEKDSLGIDVIDEADDEIKIFTSEAENRAMRWKLAYTKRYFPQYYDRLKETADKATRARLAPK